MIRFTCPQCKKTLQVKDHMAGKRGPCPSCRKIILVPQPTTSAVGSKPAANGLKDIEALAAAALLEKDKKEENQESAHVDFNCYYCDAKIQVSAEFAGKQAPCPECRRIVKVPGLAPPQKSQDWKKAEPKTGLSLARKDEPVLEGVWGSHSKEGVSRDALLEADVIKEVREPLTIQQWITRGALVAAAVVLFVGGAFWLFDFFAERRETRALALATEYLSSEKSSLLTPAMSAPLQLALAEYHWRTAAPESHDTTSLNYFRNASRSASSISDPHEKQIFLGDLLHLQLQLAICGTDQRLQDLHTSLRQATAKGERSRLENQLKDLNDGFRVVAESLSLMSAGAARNDVLRLLARTSIAAGSSTTFAQIITQAIRPTASVSASPMGTPMPRLSPMNPMTGSSSPTDSTEPAACLAILGQELLKAGRKDEAIQIRNQALGLMQAGQTYPMPLAALMLMLGDPLRDGAPKGEALARAVMESHLRSDQLDQARTAIEQELRDPTPERLDALIAFAEVMIGHQRHAEAASFLRQASELAAQRFPSESVWQRYRIVALAASCDEALAKKLTGERAFIAEPLQSRGQLAILTQELRQTQNAFDPTRLQSINPQTGAHAEATLRIARHNAQRDPSTTLDWAEGLEPESSRPLAAAGVALALRDRDP